jgi:hypothetical protein
MALDANPAHTLTRRQAMTLIGAGAIVQLGGCNGANSSSLNIEVCGTPREQDRPGIRRQS